MQRELGNDQLDLPLDESHDLSVVTVDHEIDLRLPERAERAETESPESGPHSTGHSRSLSIRPYVLILVAIDLAAAGLGTSLALVVRYGSTRATISGLPYSVLALGLVCLWPIALWGCSAYESRHLVAGGEEFRRTLNAAIWLFAAVAIAGYTFHVAASRAVVAVALVSLAAFTLVGRLSARRVLQARLRSGSTLHRALVVGSHAEAERLAIHMRRNPNVGFAVTGVHTPTLATAEERIDGVMNALHAEQADTIAIAGTSRFSSVELRRLAWKLEGSGITLLLVPDLTDLAGPRITMRPVDGLPLLYLEEPTFTGPKLVLKRAFDIVVGTGLIVVLSPVLIATALLALVRQGRPVFYRQERVGYKGSLFRLIKFRTMVCDGAEDELVADPAHPVAQKATADPRVTKLGARLRRRSLDELPQLFNVLAGSMSLVGPRPHRPFEVDAYGDDAKRRLLIKPGMTGLWQVSGRAALPWDEALHLDLRYVENWSLGIDCTLLLKTLRAVVSPRGAY